MAVRDDYLAMYSDDGEMVYCPMHHLKSVTETVGDTTGPGVQDPPVDVVDGLPDDFHGLMRSLHGRKVQVYDHGPEKTAGFVFEVGDDYVKLVTSPDEMVHYLFFHIRSVRLAKVKSKDDGSGKDGSGKDGSGKDGSGKDGSGKDGSGKDGSGKDGSGKGRSSRKNRSRSGGRGRSSGGGRGRSSGGGRGRSSSGGRGRSSSGGGGRSDCGGRGRSSSKHRSDRKSSRKHS